MIIDCPQCGGMTKEVCLKRQTVKMYDHAGPKYYFCAEECEMGRKLMPKRVEKVVCREEGCGKDIYARGLCRKHYQRGVNLRHKEIRLRQAVMA